MSVTSPQRGEQIALGHDAMVVWEYADHHRAAAPQTVDLELRDATTGRPIRTIASNVPNRGYYFWSVDRFTPVGRNHILFVGSLLRPGGAQLLSEPFDVVPAARTQQSGQPRQCAQQRQQRAVVERPASWSCSASSMSISDDTHAAGAQETSLAVSVATGALAHMSLDDDDNDAGARADTSMTAHLSSSDSIPSIVRAAHAAATAASVGSQRTDSNSANVGFSTLLDTRAAAGSRRRPTTTTTTTASARGLALVSSSSTVHWPDHPDFIYFATYMDTATVRQCLRIVVKNETVNADSRLPNGDTAGIFCIRYILMLYYKKRLEPAIEEAVRNGTYVPNPHLQRAFEVLLQARQRVQNQSTALIQHVDAPTTKSTTAATLSDAPKSSSTSSSSRSRRQVQLHPSSVPAQRVLRTRHRVTPPQPTTTTPQRIIPLRRSRAVS